MTNPNLVAPKTDTPATQPDWVRCHHCGRQIELKQFRPSSYASIQEWWSHVGGSAYCRPSVATPEPSHADIKENQ